MVMYTSHCILSGGVWHLVALFCLCVMLRFINSFRYCHPDTCIIKFLICYLPNDYSILWWSLPRFIMVSRVVKSNFLFHLFAGRFLQIRTCPHELFIYSEIQLISKQKKKHKSSLYFRIPFTFHIQNKSFP